MLYLLADFVGFTLLLGVLPYILWVCFSTKGGVSALCFFVLSRIFLTEP